MKIKKEVKISEITRCPYFEPRLDDTFKVTLKNDNFSESEYEKLCKISKSQKIKLILEIQEPILDDAERKYLSGVIKPFRDKVMCIRKILCYSLSEEYIEILINGGDNMPFPSFKKGTMYKGIKSNKEYTLEELGL